MSDQERWQLSDSGAANYQKYQVPSVFRPLAGMLLERFPLFPGDRILDLACGTGIVARLAAPMVGVEGRVVGIDLSAAMIAVAGREPAPEGAPIEWREGDAAALPFEDGAFDAVLCQQGLQFMPDKPAVLAELYRVLAPRGRLGLCVWRSVEHSPYAQSVADAITPHLGEQVAARFLTPQSLGAEALLRGLIAGAGFDGIQFHTAELIRRMLPPEEAVPGQLASTPIAPDFAALDDGTRAQIVAEVAAAMAPYIVPGGMEVPQGVYIISAVK